MHPCGNNLSKGLSPICSPEPSLFFYDIRMAIFRVFLREAKKELLYTFLLNACFTPFFNPLMNVLVVDIKDQNDQSRYSQQD